MFVSAAGKQTSIFIYDQLRNAQNLCIGLIFIRIYKDCQSTFWNSFSFSVRKTKACTVNLLDASILQELLQTATTGLSQTFAFNAMYIKTYNTKYVILV